MNKNILKYSLVNKKIISWTTKQILALLSRALRTISPGEHWRGIGREQNADACLVIRNLNPLKL